MAAAKEAPPPAEKKDDAPPPPPPARALMEIVVAREGKRTTVGKGEKLEDADLEGLTEEKHFTRGDGKPKPKLVKFNGKDARTAKTFIMGAIAGERHEFAPGDPVPLDQLDGLTENVHFE